MMVTATEEHPVRRRWTGPPLRMASTGLPAPSQGSSNHRRNFPDGAQIRAIFAGCSDKQSTRYPAEVGRVERSTR